MAQNINRRTLRGTAVGAKSTPKIIRKEYRLPADAPREKAICMYALALYEPGKYHPIDEYVGSIPQSDSHPMHFTASSLQEAAEQISKVAGKDLDTVLEALRRGPTFVGPGRTYPETPQDAVEK